MILVWDARKPIVTNSMANKTHVLSYANDELQESIFTCPAYDILTEPVLTSSCGQVNLFLEPNPDFTDEQRKDCDLAIYSMEVEYRYKIETLSCNEGYYIKEEIKCEQCLQGSWSNPRNGLLCFKLSGICSHNYYLCDGKCVLCPATLNPGITDCKMPCGDGFYGRAGECYPCPLHAISISPRNNKITDCFCELAVSAYPFSCPYIEPYSDEKDWEKVDNTTWLALAIISSCAVFALTVLTLCAHRSDMDISLWKPWKLWKSWKLMEKVNILRGPIKVEVEDEAEEINEKKDLADEERSIEDADRSHDDVVVSMVGDKTIDVVEVEDNGKDESLPPTDKSTSAMKNPIMTLLSKNDDVIQPSPVVEAELNNDDVYGNGVCKDGVCCTLCCT